MATRRGLFLPPSTIIRIIHNNNHRSSFESYLRDYLSIFYTEYRYSSNVVQFDLAIMNFAHRFPFRCVRSSVTMFLINVR